MKNLLKIVFIIILFPRIKSCLNLHHDWSCSDAEKIKCRIYGYYCQTLNCEQCEVCDNIMNCTECKSNYYMTEDSKSCYNSIIDNYYLQDNILKRCHPNCLSCIDKNNKNCERCKINYYKTEDLQSCHREEIDNYFKEGNYLKRCHGNCLRCTNEQNNNCKICQNNYYMTEDTKSCYDGEIDNYYIDGDQLKKCHQNCLRCSNEYNNNCKICQNNYYMTEDTKSCFNGEIDHYYLENNIYKKCHQNCLKCYSPYRNDNLSNQYELASINMSCIECKENFYKINGTDNCFNKSLLEENYYLKNNIFYPCDENCLTCSDEKNETSSNCLSCDNENKGLYLLEDKNNCEYSNISGYYLNIESKTLKKCYISCKTCNGPYEIDNNINIENHNCIECAENYYKLSNGSLQNNCYDNDTINSWKNIQETTNIINTSSMILF